MNKESKLYVDTTVQAIASFWNPNEVFSRASPKMMQANSKEKIEFASTELMKILGTMKEYKGSKGEVRTSFLSNEGLSIKAEYTAQATFEKGTATFDVKLAYRNDKWELDDIDIVYYPYKK